jgi:cardiolipin synthase
VVATLQRQLEGAWAAWGGRTRPVREGGSPGSISCAVAGGSEGSTGHAEALLALIRSAHREALFATPYFVPGRQLRRELTRAAARGVRVVIVLPRLNDLGWFKHAARRRYSHLLEAGVEIWERCDRMVHAKVAVIDRCLAAVGSANLNSQSLYCNSETLLITTETSVVTGIHALIDIEAAAAAERLSVPSWRRHPDRHRLAELVAAPVSLVL